MDSFHTGLLYFVFICTCASCGRGDVYSKVLRLDREVSSSARKASSNGREIDVLERKILSLESEVSDLKGDLSQAKYDINRLKNKDDEQDIDLARQGREIKNLDSVVDTLQDKVWKLELEPIKEALSK